MRGALAAADAGRLVREALADPTVLAPLRSAAAVDLVAAGKAAAPMVHAFLEASHGTFRRVIGIGPGAPPPAAHPDLRWHRAAHPVPDEQSVTAGMAVANVASAADERDLLVLLLSGGASSLMALPAEGVKLEDKRRTIRLLLEAGADIQELNTVRKHLSALKGGQLAAASRGAVLTLALSDVVDDDLSVIASGPTVADPSTFDMALEVLERRGGCDRYPVSAVARLQRGAAGRVPETPKPGDPRLARSVAHVIGGPLTAAGGARAAAAALGYRVHVLDEPVRGEARMAGHAIVEAARTMAHRPAAPAERPAPWCVIAAGETTVCVTGGGKGGRNQECALGMVRSLDTLGDAVVGASIGTDGVDGPTDAAGAIVDTTTLARAEAADIGPPERYLNDNNSYVFFDELNDLIRTGATETNVGDLQVILVR